MITKKIQMPLYLQSFSCIGSACEDSCCFGWGSITVDKKSFENFSNIQDPALREIIDTHVLLNEPESPDDSYAHIKLKDGSICPFLTEAKLCRTQLTVGESFLPKICYAFPRVTNIVNGKWEKSAVMSCPEAARRALLNPEGIEFIDVQESEDVRNNLAATIDTNDSAFANTQNQYLLDLRNFSLLVLKAREFTLEERFIVLGLFFQHLAKACNEKKFDTIPELISSFKQLLKQESLTDFLAKSPSSPKMQFKLLMQSSLKSLVKGVTNQRYAECFIEFMQGIKHNPTASLDISAENYLSALKKYYTPFASQHDYIFENYLVNYVYNTLFPLTNEDIFDEYIKLVLHYSLIKLLLVGIAGFNKGLTPELAVKLIQSFAKTIEHNPQYINNTKDWFNEKGLNSMSHLSVLIKN